MSRLKLYCPSRHFRDFIFSWSVIFHLLYLVFWIVLLIRGFPLLQSQYDIFSEIQYDNFSEILPVNGAAWVLSFIMVIFGSQLLFGILSGPIFIMFYLPGKKVVEIWKNFQIDQKKCLACLSPREECKYNCPEKVRTILNEKGELPESDGTMNWDVGKIVLGTGIGNQKIGWDITALRNFRDGRFGFSSIEYWFNGKTDPIDEWEIESDGKSQPDAWKKGDKDYQYEIKSITPRGLSIAFSSEQGKGRNVDKTSSNKEVARTCKKWIFVDRISLFFERKDSLKYYVVTGEALSEVVDNSVENLVRKKGSSRSFPLMGTERKTNDYQRALRLIHAAKKIMDRKKSDSIAEEE